MLLPLILHLLDSVTLFIWCSFTTFVITGLFAQFYKVEQTFVKKRKVEFIITSVASNSVRNSLFESILHNKTLFSGYKITVLIDEGSQLQSELEKLVYENVHIVIVPKQYRYDLLAKGRAINYFIETQVKSDWWYCFIDDDNLILNDSFLYEIPVYEKRGYVVCNPVLKPREGKSKGSYIMDWIRYFDDITLFRFFTGIMKTPILGLHGELLTVKGSILKEIGFAKHSYTEDFYFASEIVRRQYKSWQSQTILSIKSPNSLKDLLKQRGRWFKGIAKDLPLVPLEMKIIVGWRIVLWIFGIFGSWFISLLWMIPNHAFFLLAISGLYYWFIYLYAIKRGGFRYLFLIPAFGMIECISFIFGLRAKSFVVIDKN